MKASSGSGSGSEVGTSPPGDNQGRSSNSEELSRGTQEVSVAVRGALLGCVGRSINGSLIMHELGNALDEGKGKDKGRTKARLGQTMR